MINNTVIYKFYTILNYNLFLLSNVFFEENIISLVWFSSLSYHHLPRARQTSWNKIGDFIFRYTTNLNKQTDSL